MCTTRKFSTVLLNFFIELKNNFFVFICQDVMVLLIAKIILMKKIVNDVIEEIQHLFYVIRNVNYFK
jgi:hypothetical protein